MKKTSLLLLIILFSPICLIAQNIQELVQTQKPVLFEKLYLHVDREFYAPGDVIWLKTYQVNGYTHQLNSNYRNIFVELISESGKIVDDLLLFSIGGQASGELHTDTLSSGIYTIRAYTRYLENFGEEAIFHKKVWISRSLIANNTDGKANDEELKIAVDFLPEGGNMLLNAANNIAFKAIDTKGKGIYVTGKILNDLGDTVVSFGSAYQGMGKFFLMPVDGRTYHAVIDHHPEQKIELPSAKTNGICLKYKELAESLIFEFSGNMKQDMNQPFYFVASHKGLVLATEKIEMTGANQTLTLNQELFPTGISKITLLDLEQNPIAERLIFIDRDKTELPRFRLNKNEFLPREEVNMEMDFVLAPDDSIISTMSVSVVNRSFFSTGAEMQNIKSYLLLDSELKGAIESPASFFIHDEFHTSAEKLDLLMLVHGWRTYFWDDVTKIQAPSLDEWNDAGITVSGYVKRLLWKAPAPEAEVSMDYVFRKFNIGKTTADENGRFQFKQIYLLEKLRVMLNAQARDGSQNAEIILDPVPVKKSVNLSGIPCFDIDLNSGFMRGNYLKREKELDYDPGSDRILLESVEVVEKKNNAILRSYGAYPWANQTLTITRNDYSFYNLMDYLKHTLPSLTDHGDEVLMKGKPVDFMFDGLDELYSFRELRTIKMNEIATIDIVNPGFRSGYAPGTLGVVNPNGLIAIYRKEVPDIVQSDIYVKGRIMPEIKGFTVPVKFYSPEYTLENMDAPAPDVRSTLYWNPEVQFEKGHSSLRFFTADVKADYVVHLEGITAKGKICSGTTGFSVVNQ
ncbi:MAG: hypothetical protein WAO52_10980 [Prolixibacteraceae bacterium]